MKTPTVLVPTPQSATYNAEAVENNQERRTASLGCVKHMHAQIIIRAAILGALLGILTAGQLQAAAVEIISPTRAETRSDSSILSRGLHWNVREHLLTARVTFSNVNYATSSLESRHDDTFSFAIPGVAFDQARNVFYTVSRSEGRVPIARFQSRLFGKRIKLLAGSIVHVKNDHGKITLKLTAAQGTISGSHWVE